MIYLAEFSFPGTRELVSDLFIFADSQEMAHQYALKYASNWGIDFFCLQVADKKHFFYSPL
ncbi:MAG: hypothetical protein F6K16_43190 [Symploca sp. SIO2B6]|nr:hypothetical protein [Symploca sp. SIO2B6]